MLDKLFVCSFLFALGCSQEGTTDFKEEDWGEGLKVLTTFRPPDCIFKATEGDVIHYHYVGRLATDGQIFGKSFDYNTPYIVALGHRRIIAGMDRGLVDTCLWERRSITIPPHLGYGEGGVGTKIPPNATLVFYIRMVKIVRDGVSLEDGHSFTDLFRQGLENYNKEHWQETIDSFEKGLALYYIYINKTLDCFYKCDQVSADSHMTDEDNALVKGFNREFPYLKEYLNMGARSRCLNACKRESMGKGLRQPEKDMYYLYRKKASYSYLHFSYYNLGDKEEAAKCVFTHYLDNPDDQITKNNIPIYRNELGMFKWEFTWREESPGIKPHQLQNMLAEFLYQENKYQEAIDYFEESLRLHLKYIRDCRFMCEDIQLVNLTYPDMPDSRKTILDRFSYMPNSEEFPIIMGRMVQELLDCRIKCWDDAEKVNLTVVPNLLANTLNYLQFCHYQVGNYAYAVKYASTCLAILPYNEMMSDNVKFYKQSVKVDESNFNPIEEITSLYEKMKNEKRLLKFAQQGVPSKFIGRMGDASTHRDEL